MKIGKREIGGANPPYIIAEISGNHGGDLNRAIELVQAAADAGADAVKFQTFRAEDMTLPRQDWSVNGGQWDGIPVYELYRQLETPRDWHGALFATAKASGIDAFSTPFSVDDLEFLEQFDLPCYKIASNEAWDLELVRAVRATKKPVLISMGAAQGVEDVKRLCGKGVIPLYCVSEYPAKQFAFGNARHFGKVWGFSDHSTDVLPAVVAVSKGAAVIEKHLKVDDSSLDAAFSVMPDVFGEMVRQCRAAHAMMGEAPFELPKAMYTRQWFAARDIKAGETIGRGDARTLRAPQGAGRVATLPVVGLVAGRGIAKDEPL